MYIIHMIDMREVTTSICTISQVVMLFEKESIIMP